MDNTEIIAATRRWIESIVIGLNLCPFAQAVFAGERIRYVVSEAKFEGDLLRELERELKHLESAPIEEAETTLLIVPTLLDNFLDFNDFLDPAEELLQKLDLEGVIQLASFHPRYQFADTQPDDVENYSNRSPFPILHLLREESIPDDPEGLAQIPERNIATMKALGLEEIQKRVASRVASAPGECNQ